MERRYIPNGYSVRLEGAGDSRSIVGYASVFYNGTPDTEYLLRSNIKERVSPSAFQRAVQESHDVVALFNHDPSLILGRTTAGTLTLENDGNGLKYTVNPPASRADVLESVERGDITGSSFSFQVEDEEWTREGAFEIRTLKTLRLLDVSPVTMPAYKGTSVGVRGEDGIKEILASRDKWLAEQSEQRGSVAARKAVRLRMIELEQAEKG